LLLAEDSEKQTAWYLAATKANLAVLEKLYMCANKAKLNLKINLFLPKNKDGRTALRFLEEKEHIRESERLNAIELLKNYL
jgi:hypothetical protein